jgi:hypothetical protein
MSQVTKTSLSICAFWPKYASPWDGNSTLERGFSINKYIVLEDRAALHEKTIVTLLLVHDFLQNHKNLSDFPITRDLMKSDLKSNARNKEYLENQKTEDQLNHEKQKAEKRNRVKSLKQIEIKRITNEMVREKSWLDLAEKMIAEGRLKLERVMKNMTAKNFLVVLANASEKINVGLERKKFIEKNISKFSLELDISTENDSII